MDKNQFPHIDAQSPESRLAQVQSHEPLPEHRGWPGDGSGEDDLADFNQNEVADYGNE